MSVMAVEGPQTVVRGSRLLAADITHARQRSNKLVSALVYSIEDVITKQDTT